MTKVALYARYSMDGQSSTSIEDQANIGPNLVHQSRFLGLRRPSALGEYGPHA